MGEAFCRGGRGGATFSLRRFFSFRGLVVGVFVLGGLNGGLRGPRRADEHVTCLCVSCCAVCRAPREGRCYDLFLVA